MVGATGGRAAGSCPARSSSRRHRRPSIQWGRSCRAGCSFHRATAHGRSGCAGRRCLLPGQSSGTGPPWGSTSAQPNRERTCLLARGSVAGSAARSRREANRLITAPAMRPPTGPPASIYCWPMAARPRSRRSRTTTKSRPCTTYRSPTSTPSRSAPSRCWSITRALRGGLLTKAVVTLASHQAVRQAWRAEQALVKNTTRGKRRWS